MFSVLAGILDASYNGHPKILTHANGMAKPKTPCIGICSTGIGDAVCRGCKRFTAEVIGWNGYRDEERQAVLDRLASLLDQTMQAKFYIFDQSLLLRQLRFQQIEVNEAQSPYHWLFELLRCGAGQIKQLSDYGVRFNVDFAGDDLAELRKQIDAEYYALSCAYYERYVEPGLKMDLDA